MAFVKLVQVSFLINVLSYCVSGAILDNIFPTIMQEFYKFAPTEQGYRFSLDDPNGSKRDEMGIILNPGTPEQQLVVMGTYTVYDEKTDIETITMYTADKDGYRTRYKIKNRKLSASALKSAVG